MRLSVRKRSQRKARQTEKTERGRSSGEFIARKKDGDKLALRPVVEAARWRVQLAELGLKRTAEFDAWVAASPENRAAWRRVQSYWEVLGEHSTAPEVMTARRKALDRGRERNQGSKETQH